LNPTASTTPRLFSLVSAPVLTKYIGVGAIALAKLELFVYRALRTLQGSLAYTPTYWIPARLINTFGSDVDDATMPLFVSSFKGYMTALSAMLSHQSQMVWFRWLYVGWSRYMWTNAWEEIRDFS
jgi:N-acetylglucosaminylphosphatidylinositol deacetylase